jgi:hypothetical protein
MNLAVLLIDLVNVTARDVAAQPIDPNETRGIKEMI